MSAPDDDELAQRMENALLNSGKGKSYITRTAHGMVPAGTSCNVWHTKAMTIGVQVYVQLDVTKKNKAQVVIDYPTRSPPFWVVYEYRAFKWFFADIETEAEHRANLEAHYKNIKRPPKMPIKFDPY